MKTKIRILSVILAVLQCTAFLPIMSQFKAEAKEVKVSETASVNKSTANLQKYSDINRFNGANTDIKLVTEKGTILSSNKTVDYSVDIPFDGAYNLVLYFKPLDNSTQSVEYSIKIDGKVPFEEAKNLRADCIFENDGKFTTLSNGDQIAPSLKFVDGVMESTAYDITGVVLTPFEFSFSKGKHTVSVTAESNDFVIYGIKLEKPHIAQSYSQYLAENENISNYSGEQLVIEAENATYKNAYSVALRSDTESSLVSPSNPTSSVINYIGGTTWNESGQEIVWEIDIPADGMYKIGTSFKQSTILNGYVYRSLKIDGKIPFSEASELKFGYSTGWQFQSFADENGEDYLFYLTKGKHTLSLTVTLSDVAEVFKRLEEIVEMLGDMYIDIVMVTGETPDSNRDYELHKQIPNFENNLKKYKELIDNLSYDVNNVYQVNGELDGTFKNMSRILNDMLSSLYNSHLYVTSYYSYYQTLCSWLYDIKNMSLSLDKIIIAAPETEYDTGRPNIFGKMAFVVKRFVSSFAGDYNVVSIEDSDSPTLKLWVNWGRDQVKVLNSLIRQSFSAKTGIKVNVEQVNASLVQGVVSDNSPDVYLHLSRTEPVNLAMRGVIYDLSKFDDFQEVLYQFNKGAELPYTYRNGVYALPDTQTFNVMFYRTDILEELGIEIPTTWEEFLSATAKIQRKNMNVYLPYTKITADTTVNTGAGGLTVFPTMLLQKGGSVYNTERTATALADDVSVETFDLWTDFYERYGLSVDTNFTQRFRVGTIPLGIASYTQYLTFSVAAPEINGKWKIAEIPGFEQEDGTVSNICADGGSGCVLMNSSEHKQEAWEFLKWWVSADTQYEYSSNVEAAIGVSGRISTSNIEALSRLSWDKESLSVILSQWEKVAEIPEVPGSYYVSRSIDQAFWAVYNGESTPKEAITEWADISNNEIKRKIEQYANKTFD